MGRFRLNPLATVLIMLDDYDVNELLLIGFCIESTNYWCGQITELIVSRILGVFHGICCFKVD